MKADHTWFYNLCKRQMDKHFKRPFDQAADRTYKQSRRGVSPIIEKLKKTGEKRKRKKEKKKKVERRILSPARRRTQELVLELANRR
eukprot:4141810-Amphidinium_carterae.1